MKTKRMTCKQPYEDNRIESTEVQQHVAKSQHSEKESPYSAKIKPTRKTSPYGAQRTIGQKASPYSSNQLTLTNIEAYLKKTSPYSIMCLTEGVFLKIDDSHLLLIGGSFNLSIS